TPPHTTHTTTHNTHHNTQHTPPHSTHLHHTYHTPQTHNINSTTLSTTNHIPPHTTHYIPHKPHTTHHHHTMLRTVSLLLLVWTRGKVASQSPGDTEPTVTAESLIGGNALLPCDVTPPTPGDYPILVLLYNGATGMPIYSIDARSGPLLRSAHWSDLGGRAHFRMTSSASAPSGLLLNQVTAADQGLYRCRVDFVA
ncbi:hypothetical protein OTU49_003733, partial [Cherax quadricarinatus]